MRISKIAASLGESATLRLNATANALRAQGEPVIHLGGGEPKSKAPPEALQAGAALLATGEVRYTPASGTPAIKDAIVAYTREHYGHDITPANVLASGGAKQAIMVALQAVLDPGDELIFPAPYWVSYPDMARLCGAVPVPVRPADGGYLPRISDIEQALTNRTRAVMINSPNNPSGAVYATEFIADVVRFCEDHDLYLVMDDIYHRLVFDGREPISCYDYARRTGDDSRLITINGVSKQYAMTGFRLGWGVANPALIKIMGIIQGHQTSGPSALSQQAAVGALTGDQGPVDELRATLERNRDVLMESLAGITGIRVSKPAGTFYGFVDFSSFDQDSNRLARFVLEEAQVVTVPGSAFGMDGYLRISFCGSAADITEGVERIKAVLPRYRPDSKGK